MARLLNRVYIPLRPGKLVNICIKMEKEEILRIIYVGNKLRINKKVYVVERLIISQNEYQILLINETRSCYLV